ncbi:Uncharacterized protein dnl_51330 [Desulfonema limicola]|uniref:Uncharacterized protein n=1 Tax=Desulfonema limicola TaxID=45656 RepID=A0A975GIS5_9BACT|nr:hypothetical protein [Desulfonema limicola]QTA82751.1 Uncharacterized protein dnl_51330 [Desulfonema limicola]
MMAYSPYELKALKFFNQTANYAEEELGVVWFDWDRHKTSNTCCVYRELFIKGSCQLPDHKGEWPSLYLKNTDNGIEPPYNTFGCTCCKEGNMSIYDFIQKVKKCSYEEAVKRFSEFCEVFIILPEDD